ncbi:MAG: hypothetical protein IJ228_09320 [Succinivibrio sp.]|nr:hypothetical protein [Succinivibrio sp.]
MTDQKQVAEETLEQQLGQAYADSCLYDNDFLGPCLQLSREALQEMLRIFLKRDDLVIKEWAVEKTVLGVGGRSLRADAWAVDEQGELYLLEVHLGGTRAEIEQRISFQAGVLTQKAVGKGTKFEDAISRGQIPHHYLVFVSSTDPLRRNKPRYIIRRIYEGEYVDEENREPLYVEEKLHIVIINGAWQGPDPIGELVADMHERDLNKIKNPVIKEAVKSIKKIAEEPMDQAHEEKMRKLEELFYADAQKRIEAAKLEANRENARRMKSKGFSFADIADVTGLNTQEVAAL